MKNNLLKSLILIYLVLPVLSCSVAAENVRNTIRLDRFSEQVKKEGNDENHSLRTIDIKRNENGKLVITAQKWAISETGPFLSTYIKNRTLTFSSLAHCGTIPLCQHS